MKSPKVINTLLAYIWDKGSKIYKYIIMKAYECKMRAFFANGPSPMKQGGKAHKREGSDFVSGP